LAICRVTEQSESITVGWQPLVEETSRVAEESESITVGFKPLVEETLVELPRAADAGTVGDTPLVAATHD
jgi:hypothetical protein